jgi:hypothetical protein
MTTWHDEETLPEALDFFLSCAHPEEAFAPNGCHLALVITVGSGEWADAAERYVMAQTIEGPANELEVK